MLNIFEMLGASFFLVLMMMIFLWILYFFKKNAGIVDIGWAFGFVLAAWAYFFLGEGYFLKRFIMLVMVSVWGTRLAWHLYFRMVTSEEDPRYQEIRRSWGEKNTDFKFLMMFIFQGVLVIVLSLPFLIIGSLAKPGWHGVEFVGMAIWWLGFLGETYADRQLVRFKNNPDNQSKVCRRGFWRYSRHPNYFFEFVLWVGYFLFALGTPGGWLSVLSPAIMLCLLLKVSGIPMTEAEALRTKGADYEDYCRSTNPFIPWFPSDPLASSEPDQK
jgi:steroid 5-alpha reductase family enzyme